MFGRNSFESKNGASKLVFSVMMLSLYVPSTTVRPRDKPALFTITVQLAEPGRHSAFTDLRQLDVPPLF